MRRSFGTALLLACGAWDSPAETQRTQENAARGADDGSGRSVGNESIGIYASGEVLGFSATTADNNGIEGLYFDRAGAVADVVRRSRPLCCRRGWVKAGIRCRTGRRTSILRSCCAARTCFRPSTS